MSTNKFMFQIFSLLLFTIAFKSCKGQASTHQTQNNSNSTTKKEQHPKIVRTFGTQSENVVGQLLDKNGNIWFSIRGEGAYCYDGKSFINFTTKDGLCSNNVVSIIQDKAGNILFGTTRGLCKYDGNAFINIPMTDTLSITSLLEDGVGNIWFGVMNNGIYRYDGKNVANFLYKYEHPFFGEKYEKEDVHLAQAINYLEAYNIEMGMLINFGAKSLEFKGLINKVKV